MSRKSCDVLVVGAGPSGAVVSHELAAKGFSVMCLEQGDWVSPADYPGNRPEFELLLDHEWSTNPNTRKRPADYPMNVDDTDVIPIMFNAVGGSSTLYGAQWMRLMPSDFRVRTMDGICDDWPIDYWELEPYYDRVDRFIGVSGLGGDPAYPPQDFPMPPHPLGKAGMKFAEGMNRLGWHWWPGTQAIPTANHKDLAQCVRWGVCERGCPAGAKASFDVAYWTHAVRAGAQLITGARVREVTIDGHGRANGAVWIDRNGREHHQRANAVVMAGNGVGTPRLLLLSGSSRFPDGLANSSGLVGKNLMLHPNVHVVGVYDEDIETWKGPAGQLLYSLEFYETDLSRGFYRGSKINLMPLPGALHLLDYYEDRPFEEQWGTAFHAITKHAGRAVGVTGNIDDLPEESNTVTIDPQLVDSDGVPAPKIHYRFSDNTRKNMDFSLARQMEMTEASGAAAVFNRGLWKEAPGHLLGTARMGDDPAASVVDRYGRAHDVPNLFIVDGSVMVTGGGMNPTATIAALALRTAEHIAATAGQQEVPA